FFSELQPRPPKVEATGTRANPPDLVKILHDAQVLWAGGHAGSLRVEHPDDAAMRIIVRRREDDRIADTGEPLTFDAAGALSRTSSPRSAAVVARDGMIGLHAARFSPVVMRWLFFLSGVAGTLMVASGLVLWTVKRRAQLPDPKRPHLGFRLVERLNVGFVAGLPVAMLAFLWGNRLLAVNLANRADAEVKVFFYAWAGCLLHMLLRTPRQGWVEQFALASVMALALPIYNVATWHGGLFAAMTVGDGAKAGIDLALLLIGVGFLWIARKVHRFAPKQQASRAARRAHTDGVGT
ncbi:MAG TPA: PepSY-associated TM helix domain-containing protein, partial [Pseudoxanthomonas sp.]|nr:PepSY-associated TM helix domain-containing protein [Pseudoxanthomonas sp.]